MEIARIRVLPEFEIQKRREFEDREHRCSECSNPLKLEYYADKGSPHLLEEASCESCQSAPRKRVFTVQ